MQDKQDSGNVPGGYSSHSIETPRFFPSAELCSVDAVIVKGHVSHLRIPTCRIFCTGRLFACLLRRGFSLLGHRRLGHLPPLRGLSRCRVGRWCRTFVFCTNRPCLRPVSIMCFQCLQRLGERELELTRAHALDQLIRLPADGCELDDRQPLTRRMTLRGARLWERTLSLFELMLATLKHVRETIQPGATCVGGRLHSAFRFRACRPGRGFRCGC